MVGVDAHQACPGQRFEHHAQGVGFAVQHFAEVLFQVPVARQQVVEVAVQKAVVPDLLEQRMQEEPGVFDVLHIPGRFQQAQHGGFVLVKQLVDQGVLGREVVVQVAGADVQLRGDHGRRDIGLAKAVEQLQRDGGNALGGAAGRFLGHGTQPVYRSGLRRGLSCVQGWLFWRVPWPFWRRP